LPAPGSEPASLLQERIRSGTAVKAGERVRVTTRQGSALLLTVTAITRDRLSGDHVAYLPATVTWGEDADLRDDPDAATVIHIPIDSITTLVDQETHDSTRPTHAGKALMLAVFGFLLVIAWVIP
jgi:hypothetical protein